MERLPIELVNQILSNLNYFEAKPAICSSPVFYRAARFNPTKMQKPIFDINVLASTGEVPHSLRSFPESICFKFKLPWETTYEYGWSVTFYQVRENDLVPQTDQNRRILAFLKHFFNETFQYIPDDHFQSKMITFLGMTTIRFLNIEPCFLADNSRIAQTLRDIFINHKAKQLSYAAFSVCVPEIFDCVEEVDKLNHSTLSKESFTKLASLRRSRWVSIEVDAWFGDSTLLSLGGIKQLYFQGPHSVTSQGIKDFILFWLNQGVEAFDKMTEVEEDPERRVLGNELDGIWVGELSFDCNLTEARQLIEAIREPGLFNYMDENARGMHAFKKNHTIIGHENAFIIIFYNILNSDSGIQLVLFKRAHE